MQHNPLVEQSLVEPATYFDESYEALVVYILDHKAYLVHMSFNHDGRAISVPNANQIAHNISLYFIDQSGDLLSYYLLNGPLSTRYAMSVA
jgi:hypothetical protein